MGNKLWSVQKCGKLISLFNIQNTTFLDGNTKLPLTGPLYQKSLSILHLFDIIAMSAHTHTRTHTHSHFTALLDFVRDYPGEMSPDR